jgi:hypothetical protein
MVSMINGTNTISDDDRNGGVMRGEVLGRFKESGIQFQKTMHHETILITALYLYGLP